MIGAEALGRTIDTWIETDDVFNAKFLKQIIFTRSGDLRMGILPDAQALLNLYGTKSLAWEVADKSPLNGPYILAAGTFLQIRRMFDDSQGAFMSIIKPKDTTAPG